MADALELDAVIFGGGAAGLWTLDELVRARLQCVLLEAHELGSGQTVASQGIIHGGLKYTLSGLFTPSARAIAEMPVIWRRCLAGETQPRLTATRVRAHSCVLWQTASLKSKLGMLGARAGLRIAPQKMADHERPAILARCPGIVARLDEQVIDPWSFITDLSEQHRGRILKIDSAGGLEFDRAIGTGETTRVRLLNPETGEPLDLQTRTIVLTAGAGNADLRAMFGLSPTAMQRRPLHMVMARGAMREGARGHLPMFNGHCVDGAATRVTITSTLDFAQRLIWQIGGQVAEDGVTMDERALISHARNELQAAVPGIDLRGVEWATYCVDRAEAANAGARPSDVSLLTEGNVITAWPIKLALAPRLASMVCKEVVAQLSGAHAARPASREVPLPLHGWPRPVVALPPWEVNRTWIALD